MEQHEPVQSSSFVVMLILVGTFERPNFVRSVPLVPLHLEQLQWPCSAAHSKVSQLPEEVERKGIVPCAVKGVTGPPRNLAFAADADDSGDDCPDSATVSHATANTIKPKPNADLTTIRFIQSQPIS
jgi:hypothetical protein